MSHLLTSRPPAPERERSGLLAGVVALLVVLGILGGLGYLGVRLLGGIGGGGTPDYAGTGHGEVTVVVPDGATAGEVAGVLREADVVKSRAAFVEVATRRDSEARTLQPGSYRLRQQMSAGAALDLLLDPATRVRGRFTVPEGVTVARTLAIISGSTQTPLADLQAAVGDPVALGLPPYASGPEGYLFPATYDVEPGTPAGQVLARMVARFQQAAAAVDLEAQAAALGRSPNAVTTVASLLERESKVDSEYAKVARVIYNRIERGMPLQLDSTVNYALPQAKGRLTLKDLEVDSPYNTYKVKGLPPTPIGSPGEKALLAALHPADGPWLYFVTVAKDGSSLFTDDYDAFVAAKQKAQAEGIY